MPLSPGALIRGLVAKVLPTPNPDGPQVDVPIRLKKYGELYVVDAAPTRHGYAEEGSYIVATASTTGPIALVTMTMETARTAFSDTAPQWVIQNNEPNGGKNLSLDFLKLITSAAGTGATAWHYAVVVDTQIRTPTNQTLATLGSPSGIAIPSSPKVYYKSSTTASVVTASSASAVLAARGTLGGLNIVGDEMMVAFGVTDVGAQTATTAAEGAGQPGRRVSCDGPVIIPPQGSATVHLWGVGSSAALNPEFELGMWLR